MDELLLVVGDVARAGGKSKTWVRLMTDSGRLPAIRAANGLRLYRPQDVRAFFESEANRGPAKVGRGEP